MKIEQLKTTDAWALIECVAGGATEPPGDLRDRIIAKYKGTAVECDPYNYEYQNLAEQIMECEDYPGRDQFLASLPGNIMEAFYETGTDYHLKA